MILRDISERKPAEQSLQANKDRLQFALDAARLGAVGVRSTSPCYFVGHTIEGNVQLAMDHQDSSGLGSCGLDAVIRLFRLLLEITTAREPQTKAVSPIGCVNWRVDGRLKVLECRLSPHPLLDEWPSGRS
jgi:hypothetical protein